MATRVKTPCKLSYILFLHQTTTLECSYISPIELSYILFLHQTTTSCLLIILAVCCLISSFYIKPQLTFQLSIFRLVVLYPLSTSNHNLGPCRTTWSVVVLYPLSTSNHNGNHGKKKFRLVVLYPLSTSNHNDNSVADNNFLVVLYPLSTSNHNHTSYLQGFQFVVLYPLSTSNHNRCLCIFLFFKSFYNTKSRNCEMMSIFRLQIY